VTPRGLFRRFKSRLATKKIVRVARRIAVPRKQFPWSISASTTVSSAGFFVFTPNANEAWLNLSELVPVNEIRSSGTPVTSFGNRDTPTIFMRGWKLKFTITNSSGSSVWFNAPLHFRITVFSQQAYQSYLTANALSPSIASMGTAPAPIVGSQYLFLGEQSNMYLLPRDATWNTRIVKVHMDKHITLKPTIQPTSGSTGLSSSSGNQALEKAFSIWVPWNKRVAYQTDLVTNTTDLGTEEVTGPIPKWNNVYLAVSVSCYDTLTGSSQFASMGLSGVTYFRNAQ
jgi:hypothetical protein